MLELPRTYLSVLSAVMICVCLGPIPASARGKAWRLPKGYFVPGKMPMHLVHPRNSESAPWAYAKNAHSGVYWEIPIVVQGGAWPFKYEIVANGGAKGLKIGGELKRTTDGQYTIHSSYKKYGVLSWKKPRKGTYAIEVRVTDQEGKKVSVPISLTVDRKGWVFIDPKKGNDGNPGTIDRPFKTFRRLHRDLKLAGEFKEHRVYLKGLVRLDGCNAFNRNISIEPDSMPKVYVGFPGSKPILELYEGTVSIASPDFYFANMEFRHEKDFFQDTGKEVRMFMGWKTERLVLHDVHFSRFQGKAKNFNYGNSSIIMFVKNGGNPNVSVVNCKQSGINGYLTSAYRLRHAVFEKNSIENMDFRTADGSVWTNYYMKGDNRWVTLRANTCVAGNKRFGSGVFGALWTNDTEYCYNTVYMPAWTTTRDAAFNFFMNHKRTYPVRNVYVYRNSIKNAFRSNGARMSGITPGSCYHEKNILDTRKVPQGAWITNIDNADGDTFFGEDMKLLPGKRQGLLGIKGAEIAVPRK